MIPDKYWFMIFLAFFLLVIVKDVILYLEGVQ